MKTFAAQVLAVAGFVALGGVASCGPMQPPPQEEISAMTLDVLCNQYTRAKLMREDVFAAAMMREIEARGKMTTALRRDMETQTIRTGMPAWQAVCVWGPVDDLNSSGGVYGSFDQYVLSTGGYFYTRNGRVESWQQ